MAFGIGTPGGGGITPQQYVPQGAQGHSGSGDLWDSWGKPVANAAGNVATGAYNALKGIGPAQANPLAPGFDWSGNMQSSRAGLQGAIDPLQKWALTGQGPSAAQAQLQAGKDASIAAAMSMAKSMPGANPAAMQQMAVEGGTEASQQAANQAAILRAQEQQQAMQNYLGALGAQRQGDIDIYKAYADQYGQTQMANAQAKNGFMGGVLNAAGGILGKFI